MSNKYKSKNPKTIDKQLCLSIAKILNISERQVIDNYYELFSNIHPYIKRAFYHLSKMESDEMLLDASYALEFLLTFHKKISKNKPSIH